MLGARFIPTMPNIFCRADDIFIRRLRFFVAILRRHDKTVLSPDCPTLLNNMIDADVIRAPRRSRPS